MMCDLCGKSVDALSKTLVEGVAMDVCSPCTKYGKVLSPPAATKQQKTARNELHETPELSEDHLVQDYNLILKKAREKLSMTQEDFAKHINERISIVQKVERKEFEPTIASARRWEKVLHVKFVEKGSPASEESSLAHAASKEGLTLGDFMRKK